MKLLRLLGTLLRLYARHLLVLALLLTAGGLLQQHIEQRRVEAKLVATGPEKKDMLEAGLLAFGGFRGVIADVLWTRALAQQDAGRYYELKLLCDMIQKLQPTFAQVHAYQAYNMAYNLAFHSQSCEDKWFWIRSAFETLERGIARNEKNYSLWFELGYFYMDRLSDQRLYDKANHSDCRNLRVQELPRFEDLTHQQRAEVFTHPDTWQRGRARNDENLRFAAYYFLRSLQTGTDPNPLPTERAFGNCLDMLGLYRSRRIPQITWDDWGAEEWWLEMWKRNKTRGFANEVSTPQNLEFCMMAEMDVYKKQFKTQELNAALQRFHQYFPNDKRTLDQLLTQYHATLAHSRRAPVDAN